MKIVSIAYKVLENKRVQITDAPPEVSKQWVGMMGSLVAAAAEHWFFPDSVHKVLRLINGAGWAWSPLAGAVGSSDRSQSAANATVAAEPRGDVVLSNGKKIYFWQRVRLTMGPGNLAGQFGQFEPSQVPSELASFRSADGLIMYVTNLSHWDFETINPQDAPTVEPRRAREVYDHDAFATDLDKALAEVRDMLISKNLAYGDSALNPLRVFSKASTMEQLFVRIDDKLSRLKRGEAAGEDVLADLRGYLVLVRIAEMRTERDK